MRKSIVTSAALALFFFACISHARDPISDGKLQVKPVKDNQYEVGEYRFGKGEFFGYVGDLKDSQKITGIVLKQGDKASAEQKHVIAETAKVQQIDAFIELDGKIVELADDVASAAPAAGSVEN